MAVKLVIAGSVPAFDVGVDGPEREFLYWLRSEPLLQEKTENEARENEIYHPSKMSFCSSNVLSTRRVRNEDWSREKKACDQKTRVSSADLALQTN